MIHSTLVRYRGAAVALLLSFGALSAVQAQNQSFPTRHTRDAVTQGQAAFIRHLDGNAVMHLVVTLPIRKDSNLQGFLDNLQNPASPNYRQYLSVEQFTNMFAPSQNDYNKVVQWARENGMLVTETAPNRMLIQVNARVADIEKAFHVTMNIYQHPTENRTFFAPDREPKADISVALWHVSGLDNFAPPRPANLAQKPNAIPNNGSGPGGQYLGSDMRKAYYGSGSLNGTGQSVGLLEYEGYNPADNTRYFSNYGPTNHVTITPLSTDGTAATCTSCDDTEQALDIQQVVSMAPSMNSVIVYVGSSDTAILGRMVSDNSCKSLSCSWAWSPDDPKTDDPFFSEMMAQGQSFFAASGDNGSYSHGGGYYYPGEDGNIIAVGGTDLTTTGAGGPWQSETAWEDSTGGVSPDHLPIPSYQKNKKVYKGIGVSKTYRNVPDVAAEGNTDNEVCADGSCAGGWGGTSFAAPRYAGYIALANQQAVANGGSTLGFLNPEFYKIGEKKTNIYDANFHDIKSGSNGGYSAAKGYDLVTGWGSPNGPTLINTLTE